MSQHSQIGRARADCPSLCPWYEPDSREGQPGAMCSPVYRIFREVEELQQGEPTGEIAGKLGFWDAMVGLGGACIEGVALRGHKSTQKSKPTWNTKIKKPSGQGQK